MKIFKHWAKGTAKVERPGESWTIACFAPSEVSIEDAANRAYEKAARISARLSRGETPDQYAYVERPMREELLGEIHDQGRRIGAITRNSYGSLVLNSAGAMFADMDCPPAGCLMALFGGGGRRREEEIVARVRNIAETTSGLGLRLYRTAAGYRALITSGTYDPKSGKARELLQRFGSDPLYIKLCEAQECFRARLTPKYWRCDAAKPPSRYPWPDAASEAAYREWEKAYAECAKIYATCTYIGHYGITAVDARVQPILDVHDKLACTGEEDLA